MTYSHRRHQTKSTNREKDRDFRRMSEVVDARTPRGLPLSVVSMDSLFLKEEPQLKGERKGLETSTGNNFHSLINSYLMDES